MLNSTPPKNLESVTLYYDSSLGTELFCQLLQTSFSISQMWRDVWLFMGVVAVTGVPLPPADNATDVTAADNSSVATPVIVYADNSSDSSGATQTQRATCQVVTEKLVATASASVTHALKGVCATSDLEKYFMNLRHDVNSQIGAVKSVLTSIDQQLSNLQHTVTNLQESRECNMNFKRVPRSYEINVQNYTLHEDTTENKVFSYFWKVEQISSKIAQTNQHVALRSPSFYVNQGYGMYIKMFFHQDGRNVYIHVGLTHGQYDDELEWPFRLKHRVTILDQTTQAAEDIASRVWDPKSLCSTSDWQKPVKSKDNDECVGFGFTQETIFKRNYIFNDNIIVKLDVFVLPQ